MKIAYLGPEGSFSYATSQAAFPAAQLIASSTITEAIIAFESGACDFALIPIENSIEGTVNQSIDYLFHKSQVKVVGEVIKPISQCLMLVDKNKAQEIERVYSHPHALAQVRNYLQEHYPKASFEITDSTAFAAKYVSEHPSRNYAAVAPLESAAMYGLEVLDKNIQDVDDNNTRFWILGKREAELDLKKIGRKVSLALTLPDNLPGALHKAISAFAWRGIGMTKIESRPLRTTLGEYFFVVELEDGPNIKFALEELESLGVSSRLLGTYNIYQI